MSFFAVIDAATGDVLDVVMSLDHPAPPGAIVVELPGRGDDVRAWLALHGHERGGGGIDEAALDRDHPEERSAGRAQELHSSEVFFARLEQALLRAEVEGRRLAVILFLIAPSDRERADRYVRDALAAARQEVLPCDVLAALRPHLVAVLLPDIDARDLRVQAPRGEVRGLTFPEHRAEIEALRRRRHPWLRLAGGASAAA